MRQHGFLVLKTLACFCSKQRVRPGLSSSDSVRTPAVAVLSPYVAQSYPSHVDMTSHGYDDVITRGVDLQQKLDHVTSNQMPASSMTSVYDNVMPDEMTQLSSVISRKLTSTSRDHLVERHDDRMSCRGRESATVADSRPTPVVTDRRHRDHNSTVRYSYK